MQFSDYKRRSPEQQLADLNAAWDRIKKLAKTNDEQQAQIRSLKMKLWILSAALVSLWEVAKFLIELALHAH